jgi:hypothetical protein
MIAPEFVLNQYGEYCLTHVFFSLASEISHVWHCHMVKQKSLHIYIIYTYYLVGGLEQFFFHNIWDVILPIDVHIFQDVFLTTNQLYIHKHIKKQKKTQAKSGCLNALSIWSADQDFGRLPKNRSRVGCDHICWPSYGAALSQNNNSYHLYCCYNYVIYWY